MNFETITANLTSTDLPVFLFDIVPTLQSLYGILEDTKKEYERHNDIDRVMLIVHDLITEVQQ